MNARQMWHARHESDASREQAPAVMKKSSLPYCEHCGCARRFRRKKADHRLHMALTAVTLGAWGPAWLAATLRAANRPWRCHVCGEVRPTNAAHPETVENR